MRTLEDYLSGDYTIDRQDILALETTIVQVANMMGEVFKVDRWPYQMRTTDIDKAELSRNSQGTLAMVLAASGRVLGHCALASGSRSPVKLGKNHKLRDCWDKAFTTLSIDVANNKVSSGSFGPNNPITLSHISELCLALEKTQHKARETTVLRGHLAQAQTKVADALSKSSPNDDWLQFTGKEFLSNAFVALRAVRAVRELGIDVTTATAFRKYFEATLHEHLSFSAIPDSRFDPAEMLFCLEGLGLCAPQAVDAALLDQLLRVLAAKQDTSAHWRPTKPFMATQTGQIQLPLSVEGANSLMRSIAIRDADRLYDTCTAQAVPLLRRFWQWLRARAVRFPRGDLKCIGWHSEHVNEPDLIHIWDTSQILDFMLAYREVLQRHIARESLILSGVQIRDPKPPDDSWQNIVATREPVSGLGNRYKVYESVGTQFVVPWKAKEPKSYSMLLYGPPGTGKTSLAELLADSLEFRLLTVTVSDFLGRGGEMVEVRAKAVFQMLEAQSKCVILFDEIDSFLLDRDSKAYRKQDTLFQFLTPGMLTKINNLRKAERSIFIIATNYENRIDNAIKRPGRIDARYLLLPPDRDRRLAMLRDKPNNVVIAEGDPHEIGKKSLFLGFPDIVAAVSRAGGSSAPNDKIAAELEAATQSTNLKIYERRMSAEVKNFPAEEFACMLFLAAEATGPVEKGPELQDKLVCDKIDWEIAQIIEQSDRKDLKSPWKAQ